MCSFVHAYFEASPPNRVLELGSGLALSGLFAASCLGGNGTVCMTDNNPDVLGAIRRSVEVNGLSKNTLVKNLSWQDPIDEGESGYLRVRTVRIIALS